jgi:hypothetical protein
MQQKTQRPVQFELTEVTREAIAAWVALTHLRPEDFLFPSRVHSSPHLSTRQYARIVDSWVRDIGLAPGGLWDAHHAADQGIVDLPTHQESESSTAVARPYQAGKYGSLSRNRGGRRT